MTWFEDVMREAIRQNSEKYRRIIIDSLNTENEEVSMKVSYNGFTGELVNLERIPNWDNYASVEFPAKFSHQWFYNLSIFDREKLVTHFFTGVKLEDVKFLGGAVAFDG